MSTLFERISYTIGFSMMLAVIAGCTATLPSETSGALTSRGAIAPQTMAEKDGARVASDLQRRYEETTAACTWGGNAHLPAALCSGVLLRATVRGAGYHVWNPNPGSPLKRGVSFSWLRHDSAFNDIVFNYTNGFIVMPYIEAEASGRTRLTLHCIYAFDADTTSRTGSYNDGCAGHPDGGRDSIPCQAHHVFNAGQWLAKFRDVDNRYIHQCGFSLDEDGPEDDQLFMAVPAIRNALGASSISLHNEVMVGAWSQNDANLPIEAFFYKKGSDGLVQARANQADFQAATGRTVPIIEMALPTELDGVATFTYVP